MGNRCYGAILMHDSEDGDISEIKGFRPDFNLTAGIKCYKYSVCDMLTVL